MRMKSEQIKIHILKQKEESREKIWLGCHSLQTQHRKGGLLTDEELTPDNSKCNSGVSFMFLK